MKKMLMFLSVMLSSVALIGTFPAFALTQEEIDACTGPSFGISSTMTADVSTHVTSATDSVTISEVGNDESSAVFGTKGDYIGNFKATAYSADELAAGAITASGKVPTIEHTVAADTSVLPMGTKIMIEGSDIVYTVEDTGVSGQVIDLFLPSYNDCINFGVKYVDVYYAK